MAKALPYFSKIVGSSAGADAGMFTNSSLALSTACSRTSLTSEAEASAGAGSAGAGASSAGAGASAGASAGAGVFLWSSVHLRQNEPLKKEGRKPSCRNQQTALHQDP